MVWLIHSLFLINLICVLICVSVLATVVIVVLVSGISVILHIHNIYLFQNIVRPLHVVTGNELFVLFQPIVLGNNLQINVYRAPNIGDNLINSRASGYE